MSYEELRQYALTCGNYYRGTPEANLVDVVKGIAGRFPVPSSLAIAMAEMIEDQRRAASAGGERG